MAGSNIVQAIGPTYHLADVKASVQSAINCFPRKLDGKWVMVSAPGTTDIVTLGGECRASRYVDGRWFIVAGNTVYEQQTSGSYVSKGNIITSTGKVSMSNNNTQVAIVDGTYLYNLGLFEPSVVQVMSTGWQGSERVEEMDGYFIFAKPDSDQFYISAIDDVASLDPLDFSSADSVPGKIVAHIVSNHQLFIYKEKSREIWVNSGSPDFPFTRYNSFPSEVGCVGPHALVSAAGVVYFVGNTERGTAMVYEDPGTRPAPVSTTAIEELLRTCTDLSQIEMMAYQPKGHEFITIRGPGMKTMAVYDVKNKLWHERGEWVNGDWAELDWRFITAIGKEHYGGDEDGKVFRLDDSLNQYSGRVIKRERTWPHLVTPSLEPVSYRGLELSMQTGNGGNIMLQVSNDGGSLFGPPLLRDLGATGRRMQRIRWMGLGAAINRVFRLTITDNVPFNLYSASVEA